MLWGFKVSMDAFGLVEVLDNQSNQSVLCKKEVMALF